MTAFSIQFLQIPIWVQVWGLPFDLINVEAGRDIGNGIGHVVDIDCKAIHLNKPVFFEYELRCH